jgi:hypothetical protein
MMQTRRIGKAAATPESLKDKIARLSESEREAVRKVMDQFLEQSWSAGAAFESVTVSAWRHMQGG